MVILRLLPRVVRSRMSDVRIQEVSLEVSLEFSLETVLEVSLGDSSWGQSQRIDILRF